MLDKINQIYKTVIQPRQLIIRQNGDVGLLNLPRWTQLFIIMMLLIIMTWLGVVSHAFFNQQITINTLKLEGQSSALQRVEERASLQQKIQLQEQRLEQLSSQQELLQGLVDALPETLISSDNQKSDTKVIKQTDPKAFFKSRSDHLETSQNQLITLLSSSIEIRIDKIKTGLTEGGLSTDIRTKPAQGGPYHQLDITEIPKEYVSTIDKLVELNELESLIRRIPNSMPVAKDKYYVSSPYGFRKDPMTGKRAFHKGVDLAGWTKTEITAPADGVVIKARKNGGFGKFIEIQHENGITTRYGHLHTIKVKKGQKVAKSDVIALMGSSGRSTSTHLHYEVLQNKKHINPIKLTKAVSRVQ